jgi:GST-like protein
MDLYFWPTPNGKKISIFMAEAALPYSLHPINIMAGAQFDPEYLKISPNNKIPCLVDDAPADHGAPLAIFESGAILQYLAEKTGQFLPSDLRGRQATLQWLYWQMAGLGPNCGQTHHFLQYAPEKVPYAITRFTSEVNRLYGVLNKQLAGKTYVIGDAMTIADMAIYPWIMSYAKQGQDIHEFPHIQAWLDTMGARPGVQQGMAVGADLANAGKITDASAQKILFGQTSAVVSPAAEQ